MANSSDRVRAAAAPASQPQPDEVVIEMRVPFSIYGRLGIGAKAWSQLLERETYDALHRATVMLPWSTFKAVMNALRHCGEKHYVNPGAVPASPWQPMSCAPKDGTVIDIWCASADGVEQWRETNCTWFHTRGLWCNNAGKWDCAIAWMPLPDPPAPHQETK